jgi:F-type H+-transporting ATPase subunit delta
MKINKDIRRRSREMLRGSFTDRQLDRGKINAVVEALVAKKPRHYIDILSNYKRLLRLEVEKRHALIESATELSPEAAVQIVQGLQRRYGGELTTKFSVDPTLLGGLRVRVGSDVWDGTVRNRLQRLETNLALA